MPTPVSFPNPKIEFAQESPMRHASNVVRLSGVGLVLAAGLAMASVAAAANTPTEAANKKLVLDFYAALNEADATNSMKERIPGIAEKYLSPEYTQHTIDLPGPGTDREKLIKMFQNMPTPPAGAPAMPRQRTDAVMAEGDRVMLLTSREQRDPATGQTKPSYVFNMFRVKDGKLVEHWDVRAPPPAGGPGGPGAPGGAPGAPPGR
jgi:predicted SnoaL-like aldol condensation-catalyzing enzyme